MIFIYRMLKSWSVAWCIRLILTLICSILFFRRSMVGSRVDICLEVDNKLVDIWDDVLTASVMFCNAIRDDFPCLINSCLAECMNGWLLISDWQWKTPSNSRRSRYLFGHQQSVFEIHVPSEHHVGYLCDWILCYFIQSLLTHLVGFH